MPLAPGARLGPYEIVAPLGTGGYAAQELDIAVPPSDGLTTAHAARIVHCDPKAGNILITREGRVKVPDFGLARTEAEFGSDDPTAKVMLTDPGTPLGTIAYMSPERHGERPISALSRTSFRWVWCFTNWPRARGHSGAAARRRPSISQRGTRFGQWPPVAATRVGSVPVT